MRNAATLHYELVPYLYALALDASRTGIPVVRPLGLTWPTDQHAWSNNLEFTVGDALLAAPVDTDGSTSTVYLPSGNWIDIFTGETGWRIRNDHPANGPYDFPLYLRAVPQSQTTSGNPSSGLQTGAPTTSSALDAKAGSSRPPKERPCTPSPIAAHD